MATSIPSKTEPPEFLLDAILEGAEFTLYRAREHGNRSPILVVAPTAEQPLPQSLRRLEHEYSLAAELEPAWAAKPLALTLHDGRTILFSPTRAVSLSTAFWNWTGNSLSIWRVFYPLPLTWQWRSATSTNVV